MKSTVYIETTIISYLTAWPSKDIVRLSHQLITRDWWLQRRDAFDLYASDFVIIESSRGDSVAAAERLKVLDGIPILPAHSEAVELAKRLAVALALPERARIDASHVAISAVYGISFLLTWNCRHLANGALAARIEATCASAGFRAPRIVTPEQLLEPT